MKRKTPIFNCPVCKEKSFWMQTNIQQINNLKLCRAKKMCWKCLSNLGLR